MTDCLTDWQAFIRLYSFTHVYGYSSSVKLFANQPLLGFSWMRKQQHKRTSSKFQQTTKSGVVWMMNAYLAGWQTK